jgi:hypothetical protein
MTVVFNYNRVFVYQSECGKSLYLFLRKIFKVRLFLNNNFCSDDLIGRRVVKRFAILDVFVMVLYQVIMHKKNRGPG